MVDKKIGIAVLVLLSLLMIPIVFALDTEITVRANPGQNLHLRVLDINNSKTLPGGFFNQILEDNGELIVDYSSDHEMIHISTYLKGVEDSFKKHWNLTTGGSIYIDLTIEDSVPVVKLPEAEGEAENETIANETEINASSEGVEDSEGETQAETEETGKITGGVISAGKAIVTSKITYYIIGGLFILGVLFFIVFIIRKKLKSGGHYVDFKIKKDKGESREEEIDDKKEELDNKIESHDKRLDDAEKKLQEAKEELDEIKNRKGKLQEAKERFEKDKKELERLEED